MALGKQESQALRLLIHSTGDPQRCLRRRSSHAGRRGWGHHRAGQDGEGGRTRLIRHKDSATLVQTSRATKICSQSLSGPISSPCRESRPLEGFGALV
jgi:hypothetical protein